MTTVTRSPSAKTAMMGASSFSSQAVSGGGTAPKEPHDCRSARCDQRIVLNVALAQPSISFVPVIALKQVLRDVIGHLLVLVQLSVAVSEKGFNIGSGRYWLLRGGDPPYKANSNSDKLRTAHSDSSIASNLFPGAASTLAGGLLTAGAPHKGRDSFRQLLLLSARWFGIAEAPRQRGANMIERILRADDAVSFAFESTYCFAASRSMVNLTSSPTTAVGNLPPIPKSLRLIVVVAEKPE